jgi:hypothetical protein
VQRREQQRQKKIDSIMVQNKIGDSRRRTREEDEKQEAMTSLQEMVREQSIENQHIRTLQRTYRGHIRRKVVKRWALKCAEMKAMFQILSSSAYMIQRCYRGYRGIYVYHKQ